MNIKNNKKKNILLKRKASASIFCCDGTTDMWKSTTIKPKSREKHLGDKFSTSMVAERCLNIHLYRLHVVVLKGVFMTGCHLLNVLHQMTKDCVCQCVGNKNVNSLAC